MCYNIRMKTKEQAQECEQCGSNNTKILEAGYNTVLWCGDCSYEEHRPFEKKEKTS